MLREQLGWPRIDRGKIFEKRSDGIISTFDEIGVPQRGCSWLCSLGASRSSQFYIEQRTFFRLLHRKYACNTCGGGRSYLVHR